MARPQWFFFVLRGKRKSVIYRHGRVQMGRKFALALGAAPWVRSLWYVLLGTSLWSMGVWKAGHSTLYVAAILPKAFENVILEQHFFSLVRNIIYYLHAVMAQVNEKQ